MEARRVSYVDDASAPGFRRIGTQKHPRYIKPSNKTVTDRKVLSRIQALATIRTVKKGAPAIRGLEVEEGAVVALINR